MANGRNKTGNKGAGAAPAPKTKGADAPQAAQDAPKAGAPAPASRGPRGVLETAKITVLHADNPKRAGSQSHTDFAKYRTGMTVGEFCDAVGKRATPHLVYDTQHGFISIEGYDPAKKFVPKPKAVKEPKASPKAKAAPKAKAQVDEEATEETVD